MRRRALAFTLAALAAALLLPGVTTATTVVPVAEPDLVDHARAIVIGQVTAIESQWDARALAIWTHITLDADEIIKGRIGPGPLTIRQLGGRVGGVRLSLDGSPEFAVGERALVFLRVNADGTARVMHLYQGKFTIEADEATGEPIAVRRPGRDVHVMGPGRSVLDAHTHAAPVERQRLEDLKRRIRSRLAVSHGAPAATLAELTTTTPAAGGVVTETTDQFTFLGSVPSRWTEPDSGQSIRMLLNGDGDPSMPGLGFGPVRDAYSAWNAVTTSRFRYADGGFTTAGGFALDGVNAVSFRDPLGQIDPPVNCTGALAVGGFWRDESQTSVVNGQTFARTIEGDLVFADGWDSCGLLSVYANLAEIATHELGHVLGLGHSSNPDATMYAFAHFDGRGASLRDDDRAGVTALYPAPVISPLAVGFTSPSASASVSGTVTVAMAAVGGAGGYTYRLAVDGVTAYTGTSPSFSWNTTAVPNGSHSLTATVTDSGGRTANASLTVNVANQTASALKVFITGPLAGATVSGVAWVDVWVEGATGAANTFTISVAGSPAGSQTSSGAHVTIPWDTRTVGDGPQTLTADVRDATGKTGSASISVTVKNGASTPPPSLTASFTTPTNGATVSGTVTVGMAAAGGIGSVTFKLTVDGAAVFTQTVSGAAASFAWNTKTAANGAHALGLTVTDGGGRGATATLNVTVANASVLKAAFTSPIAGATVSGAVTVGVSASGVSGDFTGFRLAIDSVVVFDRSVAGATASYAWDTTTVGNGAHTLTLTVTDAAAGTVATATMTVTVNNVTGGSPGGTLKIAFTSPAANATVSGVVWVNIWVEGASGSANTFTLSAAGSVVRTETISGVHVTFPWDTRLTPDGPQALTATVRDATGATGTGTLAVTVSNGTAPPPPPPPAPLGASFTSPANGATVSGTVNVGMTASGVSGGSATFTLAIDGVTVFTQTAATSATYSWNTIGVANGSHTLALTVTDPAGRSASASVSVGVNNVTAPPPPAPSPSSLKVFITSPAAGATVSGVVWVNIWVEGASGTANTFTLFAGTTVIRTEVNSGVHVTFPWDTRAGSNGPQTMSATVTDATGASGNTTRSVSVAN